MISMDVTAIAVDLSEDLLPLSVALRQQGVRHRIFEEQGRQTVKTATDAEAREVQRVYQAWRSGELNIEITARPREAGPSLLSRGMRSPVTLAIIALSVAGFALLLFRASPELLSLFTFTPFAVVGNQLVFGEPGAAPWRYITPVFLHFGWLHITFNCLWMWELGSRIERGLGSLNLLGLFLVIALVSNTIQYLFGGPALFGGLSGVVYGLRGCAWVGATLQPAWGFRPANPIMLFMLGWLVICVLGVVEVLGFGAVANAAHVGGLLTGALLGAVFALASR